MKEAEKRQAIIKAVVRSLAEERARQGISRNALAAKAGLSQSVVSRLESGVSLNPTIDSMLRIADALSVDLGSVFVAASKAGQGGH